MGIQTINQLPNKGTASNQDILIHQKIFANDPRLYAIKKKDLVNPTNKLVRYSKQAPDTVNTPIKPRGQGTLLNPYKISCLANLVWMQTSDTIDGVNYATRMSSHYLQTHDIDCKNAVNFQPIGTGTYFSGTYDGKGKVIKNLTISGNIRRVGLFGRATVTSIIKNVTIQDSYFSSTWSTASQMNLGVVVGAGLGVCYNCKSINNYVKVNGTPHIVGGLFGGSYGYAYNCISMNNTIEHEAPICNGSITGIVEAYGGRTATVQNCIAINNQHITSQSNKYAIGRMIAGKIIDCYFDKDTTNATTLNANSSTKFDNTIGLTTQQLKNLPLHYLKLDTSVWKRDANGVPQLWSHYNPDKYSKKVLILANNSTSMAYPTKAFTVSQILHSLPTSSVKLVANQTHNIPITGIDGNVYNYPFTVEQVKTKQNDGMIKQSQAFSSGNYSMVDSIPENSILDSITFRRIATGSIATIVVRRNGTSGVVLGTASLNHPVGSVAKVQLNRKYFSDDFTSSLNLNFSTTTNCQVSVKYSTDYTNQIITILD